MHDDQFFMQAALEQAKLALEHDDIPVGAVVVLNEKIIGVGKNERELLKSPTAHAEIQALNAAAKTIGHWNLSGCKLYVTLEPCVMCSGALVLARIQEVIFAAEDPKGGAIHLEIPILNHAKLNHRVAHKKGPLAEEASGLLKEFFKAKRRLKNTSGKKD